MADWGITDLPLKRIKQTSAQKKAPKRCFKFADLAPKPNDPLRIAATNEPTGKDGKKDLHVAICELDIFCVDAKQKTASEQSNKTDPTKKVLRNEQPFQMRVIDLETFTQISEKKDWKKRLAHFKGMWKHRGELKAARALGVFRLQSDGTKVTARKPCLYSPDPHEHRKGFFDGWWSELRIEQPKEDAKVVAEISWDTVIGKDRIERVRYKLGGLPGKNDKGQRTLRLEGEATHWVVEGKNESELKKYVVSLAMQLTATDDRTLEGWWWRPKIEKEDAAKDDPRHRIVLKRWDLQPSAPPVGLEVPIEIANGNGGYDKSDLKLWIPWEEIEQEFLSEVQNRLQGKHDRVYLELALAEATWSSSGNKAFRKCDDDCSPEACSDWVSYRWDPVHYLRYPVEVDGKLQRELALEALFAQGFSCAAGLWAPRFRRFDKSERQKREGEEILRRLLEHAYYVGPMCTGLFVKQTKEDVYSAWNKGLRHGLAQREATQCSLVFRFAAAGYEPEDPNPFRPEQIQHAEFECYRCWKDVITEAKEPCVVLEGGRETKTDTEQAGRVWVLPPWPYEDDDPLRRGCYVSPYDFDAATLERITVPEGLRVVLSDTERPPENPIAEFKAGTHTVKPNQCAKASRLWVMKDPAGPKASAPKAKWLEDVDPAKIREAYLRGRQAHRVSALAATSAAPTPPSILVSASRFYGLEPQDVEALFAGSWASARIERETRMVFSLASLGFDPKKPNPFEKLLKRAKIHRKKLSETERRRIERARDDFNRYAEIYNKPRYRKAYERGKLLNDIFRLGLKVGSRRKQVANVDNQLRLMAKNASIEEREAKRLYERGYEIARNKWLRDQFRIWWERERETIQNAIRVHVQNQLESGSKWPEHRYYVANLKRKEFKGILHTATHKYRLPDARVERMLTRLTEQVFKIAWEQYSRQWYEKVGDAIKSFFQNVLEYAGLIATGVGSWIQYGAVLVGLMDEPEKYMTERYIEQCIALFGDRSALGWVVKEDWTWYQGFGRLFLGIGNVFMVAGTAALGIRGAVMGIRGAAQVGWGASMRALASGGVQWARQQGGRWLLNNVALSGSLGVVEEACESWILDEEFSLSDALAKTLRNTALFGTISGLSAAFGAAKLSGQFHTLLFLPQAGGVLVAASDLWAIEPKNEQDRERRRHALLAIVNEALGTLLMVGASMIGSLAARKFMEEKGTAKNVTPKRHEKLKKALEDPVLKKAFEQSVKAPKARTVRPQRKLPFDSRNPHEVRRFVAARRWSQIENEIRPHLEEYTRGPLKGKLRAEGADILQQSFTEFLAAALKDPKRLEQFLDDVGSYQKLRTFVQKGIPSRSDAYLSNLAAQPVADRLLFEWLLRKGKQSKAVAEVLAVECPDGWPGVMRVRERLPKTKQGALTPEAEEAFGHLLVGYLEACKGDENKLNAMLADQAPHFHLLDRIEAWLPKNEHGLPTARAKKAWGDVLVAYLEKRIKTDEDALKFYKEVGGWDTYLRPLEAKLPRDANGELTAEARAVWDKLHQARTNLCERLYKELYEEIKSQYGVELIPPGGKKKYFIGTPPGHEKFKGVNSDLDFNLTFKEGGAGNKSFVEQELILIEAKRKLEAKLRAYFDDPGVALDTNVYVRIDGFPVELVSKRFWQARERYWDMVKLRFGCEDNLKMWESIKNLIRKTTSKEDRSFVEAYFKAAEKRYTDFERAVTNERKAIESKWNAETHDELVTALARQRVIHKMEDDLIAFLKQNKEALQGKGKEADQMRALYNARKQDYISMLPETYMSKASLDKVVAEKQVTLLERIHAKVDQIRYLLVKFNHTHGKPDTYRLWKLAKYEMRKLQVDDLELGSLYKLLDTLKGAKTHDEAIKVLKETYGAAYETKAKQLVEQIRQRIDMTLEQWANLTKGALTEKTPAAWKDYVPSESPWVRRKREKQRQEELRRQQQQH